MRAREFIIESFIVESYPLARTEFIRAATAKFGPEAVAKIGTKDEPKEVTQEINNVKQLLDQHRELAKKNQFRNPEEKDINHWRRLGWNAFSQMIKLKSSDITDSQRKRGKVVGNAITLQDDAEWTVIIPLDKETSVHYGKGTEWCTTKANRSNFENYFYRDKIALIYAIPKDKSSNQHVAISINPDGDVEMFNRADDPIDAQQYIQISGLDPNKFIAIAKESVNQQQMESARIIYKQAIKDTSRLLQETPLDPDAIERALKITKKSEDCYDYIVAYGREQNKRVTVHPIVIVATAMNITDRNGEAMATEVGQYIDFAKIPMGTFKSILKSAPLMFMYNANALSENQQQLLASTPASAYYYAFVILDRTPFPEVEDIIATDATYSYKYARYILGGKPFPAGEPAIRKSFTNASLYTNYCVKTGSPTWEALIKDNPELTYQYVANTTATTSPDLIKIIASDAKSAYNYATYMLDNDRFPEGEPAIATSAEYSVKYSMNVLKGKPFPEGEPAIANSAAYSFKYALEVRKFPEGEPAIAKDAHWSYTYAYYVLQKTKFPAGEPAIAKDARYSYLYAVNILKNRFLEGEAAIATDKTIMDNYKVDVIDKYAYKNTSITSDPKKAYEHAMEQNKRFPEGEKAIATSADYSYLYALYVMQRQPFPLGEPAIARNADIAFDYAKTILERRFLAGEPAIARNYMLATEYDEQFGTNLAQQ